MRLRKTKREHRGIFKYPPINDTKGSKNMNMKINISAPVQDTDFSLSCEFDMHDIGYNQQGAFGVTRFNLHTPDGSQWRKVAAKFNENGVDYIRRLCVDTYEYASLVDNNPDFKSVENELCDSICMIIGRTVRKHFKKEN